MVTVLFLGNNLGGLSQTTLVCLARRDYLAGCVQGRNSVFDFSWNVLYSLYHGGVDGFVAVSGTPEL